MFVIYVVAAALVISILLVLTIREYFKTANKILAKNSTKRILQLHLKVCEIVSIYNKIFSIPMGFFNYANQFITTFSVFEIYDIITSKERTESQNLYSIGFFYANSFFYIGMSTFLCCCAITSNEQQRAVAAINRGKLFGSNRKFIAMLQFEATKQKFSWGLFELDLKTFCAVSCFNKKIA